MPHPVIAALYGLELFIKIAVEYSGCKFIEKKVIWKAIFIILGVKGIDRDKTFP